jgi:SAM-dependent methyltransferase
MDPQDTVSPDRAAPEADHAHKIYPKQFDRDDFWSQIKRTVNGEPVSEEDIQLIVTQIRDQLALAPGDHLLDLGCGNAALASRLFEATARYTGVDFSSYLLEIASEYFSPDESIRYVEADAAEFVKSCDQPEAFDKVLCYGCMSYLSREDLLDLISTLHDRFPRISKVFFGNVPDRAKAAEFFAKREVVDIDLDDPRSPIGVWWHADELNAAASSLGFSAQIVRMPAHFYGAAYRFDLLLTRAQDAGAGT